jgi:hypothetical protein
MLVRNQIYSSLAVVLLVACGSDHDVKPDAMTPTVDSPVASVDAPTLEAVTFSYTPGWAGVNAVDLYGAFGTSTDWTSPYMTLTANADNTVYSGSAMLVAGTYTYLFQVIGDDAAATGKTTTHPQYSLDPTQTGYAACPSGAPTYSATATPPNPCSQLAVPQGAAATLYTISGTVDQNGSAAGSYLVVVERDEETSTPATHHYFANRATTAANGTYSLSVAPGHYLVDIEYPGYESMEDSQLDPVTEGILRRDVSSVFDVTAAAQAIPTVDMVYAGYATFLPTGTVATTPAATTFTFPTTTAAKLDIYGNGNEIGDPWYAAAATTTGGSAAFGSGASAGEFNTKQAGSAMGQPPTAGTKYWWGLELPLAASGGVAFTQQTMVMPITWSN